MGENGRICTDFVRIFRDGLKSARQGWRIGTKQCRGPDGSLERGGLGPSYGYPLPGWATTGLPFGQHRLIAPICIARLREKGKVQNLDFLKQKEAAFYRSEG